MAYKTAYQQALESVKNKVGSLVKKVTTPIDYNNVVAKPQATPQQNFQKTFARDYNNWQAQQTNTQQQNRGGLISVFKNVKDYFNPNKDTNPSTSKVDNFWTAKVPVGINRAANVIPYGIKAVGPNLKQQVGVLLKQPKAYAKLAQTADSLVPDILKAPLYQLNPGLNAVATTLKADKLVGSPLTKTYNAIAEAESRKGGEIISSQQAIKDQIQAEKERAVGVTPQHQTFLENIQDPRYVADVLGYQAPQFVADLGIQAAINYVTGGAGVVNKVASYIPLYLASANEAYSDAKQTALQNGKSEAEAESIALQTQAGVGMINGLLDKIGLDTIFGKLFARGVSQEVVQELKGTLVKNILQRLGDVTKTSLIEGGTEGLQQVVLNAAAKLFYDPDRKLSEQVADNTFFGMVMGGLAKFGVEIPQESLAEIQHNNKLQAFSQIVLGANASSYETAEDFAEAEFKGSTTQTQVGFTLPNKITTTIAPIDAAVERIKYILSANTELDPVVVTANDQGQLTVTDQESANILAAYQSVGKPIPVINQSDIKLPELLTVEQVYRQEQEKPQKPEDVQSLITEDMENFNPDAAMQIRDKGDVSTEPLGTEFNTESGDAKAVIKSVLNNRQLEDLQVITNNSKDMVNPKTGELVWGKYYDSVISVVEQNGKVQDSTLYHEAFHYYADKLADKETYNAAIKEAKDDGMVLGNKEYSDPSEYLADGFALFIRGRGTFTGKVLAFFQDMLTQVRTMIGKANAIEMLYYNAVKGSSQQQATDSQVSPAYRNAEMLQTPEQEYRVADKNANIFFSQERAPENAQEMGFEDIKQAVLAGDHAATARITQEISNQFDKMFFPDIPLENQQVLGVYFGGTEGSNRIVVRRPEDMNIALYKALVFAKYNHQDSVFTQDFSREVHPNLHLDFTQELSPEQQVQISNDIAELSNGKFAGASIIPGENRIQISYVPEYADFSPEESVGIMEDLVVQLRNKGYQFADEKNASQNSLIFNQDYDSRIQELSSADSGIQRAIETARNADFRRAVETDFGSTGHILSNPDYFWASISGTPGPQYRTTGEFVKASDEEVDAFDSQEYAKEEIKRREDERLKASEPATIKDKVQNVIKTLRYSMVDRFSPIEDVLNEVEKRYKLKILPTQDFRYQLDRVLRFGSLADNFAKKYGLIKAIQDVPDIDVFEQYLTARHSLDLEKKGIETGRDLRKDDMLVRQQEERFKDYTELIDGYRKKLLDYHVETGLISPELRQMLIDKYPYYVPSQRVFDEIEANRNANLSPHQVASIAQQTIIREIKGSERAIENPLAAMFLQTRQSFEQGERNKAARMLASYKDLPGNPFDITPLRTAENVLARMDILGDIKQLGEAKRPLERILKTRKRWLRSLMSELNALNKKGLHIALKPEGVGYSVDLTTNLETGTIPNLQFGEGDLRDVIVGTTGAENPDVYYDFKESKMGNREVKQIINNMIKIDRKGLELIRKKIARRDVKLNSLINEIETIKTVVDDINAKRSELFNEEKLVRDAKARGKATISAIKNGVKEIYEIDPEIEKVVKHLDKGQMDAVTKVLHYFTRALQMGATGYNIPFVVFNAAKDQITALINSDSGLKYSVANPGNFVNALTAAFTHTGVYDKWVGSGSAGTMYDMTRENAADSLQAIRARKNLKSKIAYTATHPGALFNALENIIGRGEEFTRIQQYLNKKQEMLDQGRTEADADILAANASRFNTANFARGGAFARVANFYIPFFNAGIQGSRSFSRALVTRPVPTIMKLASFVYMPMAAATLWNMGDDERKKVYGDIQEWEKEDNFVLVLDGATKNSKGQWENVIKIPIPPGLSNVASLVRRPLEQLAGEDPVTAKEVFDDLVQAGTSFDVSSYKTFLNSTVPQFFKPIVEIGTNADLFTGKEIVPSYMANYKPEEQVYDYTSGTAIGIAKALNMSPIMVEKEISTMFGGVGKQLLNASDQTLAKTGVIDEKNIGGESMVANVLNRTTKARGGDDANEIYAALNESDATKRQDRAKTIKDIKEQISVSPTTIQTLTAGMDSESANSVIDAAFEKKLRESMDATEKAIQSSTKDEREMLAKKDPNLIPIISAVTQKENASKLQAKIAKSSIKTTDVSGLSASVAEKQKRSDQFTTMHELEKAAFDMGIPKDALKAEYERLGITPDDSEYDKLTALPDDLQLDEIKAQVDGLTGDDLLASLLSMRVVSEGTRKMLLTDSLIGKLVGEGMITKEQGQLLEDMTWDDKTKTFSKKPSSGGSSKKPAKVTLSKVMETPKLKLPSVSSGGGVSSVKLPRLATSTANIPKPPRMQVRTPQRLSAGSLVKLRAPVKSIYSLGRAS